MHSIEGSTLASLPEDPVSILSVSKRFSIDNVYQTHLVLASGKLELQKSGKFPDLQIAHNSGDPGKGIWGACPPVTA